ncbi:Tetratricopeptide repeat-containing protein [Oryctes borbonicus]|uniref:Tetratricopeptide repeat-containing protein n=1 Tax=Oryctes borbonicus TaxID=1629725 RepID=A0A0T6AUJ8_9SCAR|nr:Tetratricopeptide repeat-containing protein [Oryctes borbonicus]
MENTEIKQQTPEELKELGNQAVKGEKFAEAVLHYSYAIKLDPNNYVLYSNRSYAYLKMLHYYSALEDAHSTIQLNPTGPKGYFRKAEVEFATKHYRDAVKSYEQALYYLPHDETVKGALIKATAMYISDKRTLEQIPWVGSGIGIVIGVLLVILDYIATAKSTHPLLMAFITILISLIGYGLGKGYCYYEIAQRDGLIQPPPNLFEEDDSDKTNKNDNSKGKSKLGARFTKSQARQRYKKGKLS